MLKVYKLKKLQKEEIIAKDKRRVKGVILVQNLDIKL